MMKRIAITLLLTILPATHLAAQLSGGGKPGDRSACTELAHECCWLEAEKIVTGEPMNQAEIDRHKGPENIDWWGSGESENIPTLCRIADYWKNGNDAWLHGYYDDQLPGGPAGGFQGSEVLSPLYMPWMAASHMAVLEKAKMEGHTSLQAKVEDWLRTYWALNALMAHQGPWTQITSVSDIGTFVDADGNAPEFDGLSTPVAGSRRVSVSFDPTFTGQAEVHIGQYLLTLALDHSPRRLDRSDLGSEYFRALVLAVHVLGGTMGPGGDTLDLASVPAPVEKFGLTASERATLKSFVANPGVDPATMNAVVGMIGHGTRCKMTFLRTTEGTSSWFGDDTVAQGRCNNNTAPWYGVTMNHAGEAQILTPSGQSFSRRSGTKVEADHVSFPGNPFEIDVIGGDTIYRVAWRSNGPVLAAYDPPNVPVDLRLVASYLPSASGPRTELESDSDTPAPFGFYYDESLGNFEEQVGGPCNSGQNNPTYLEIRFEGESFDSCSFQGSWDAMAHPCSQTLKDLLIAGGSIRINTNDYDVDPATCSPIVPLSPRIRPFEQHWMRLSLVKDGQTHHRRVNFFQNNPTPPEVLLTASYVPAPGQARTEFRSEQENPTPFDFYFDESAGSFEERPGGVCHTGQNNPTYLKISYDGPAITDCSFQASWDQQPQTCSPGARAALNGGQEITLSTDRYRIDTSTCQAIQPLELHLPFHSIGWMRLDVTTAEGSFSREVRFIKRP